MCIEHLTAIVAAEILKNRKHLEGTDLELRKLWLWHAIEEVEHKAVAFDVWMFATREWSGVRRWFTRSALLLAVSISFFINRTRGQVELLNQDGLAKPTAWWLCIRNGFAKGAIGRNVMGPWLEFFRPGFHPNHIDDRELLVRGENMLAAIKLVTEGAAGDVVHTAPPLRERSLPPLKRRAALQNNRFASPKSTLHPGSDRRRSKDPVRIGSSLLHSPALR